MALEPSFGSVSVLPESAPASDLLAVWSWRRSTRRKRLQHVGESMQMIAVAFSALVMLGLLSIGFHWYMRIRLLKMDLSRDRIEWLSFRGGDDVLTTYEDLFPRSVLPRFCRFVFWAVIFFAAAVLFEVIVKFK